MTVVDAARELANALAADVSKAANREDHILRVQRANEAAELARALESAYPAN